MRLAPQTGESRLVVGQHLVGDAARRGDDRNLRVIHRRQGKYPCQYFKIRGSVLGSSNGYQVAGYRAETIRHGSSVAKRRI